MSTVLAENQEEEQTPMTPGEIIAEMIQIRDEKSRLKEREKALNEIWRGLEAQLMEAGDKMGMKRMSSDIATATITEETLPMVDDWDSVYRYIVENDACHLLQRRVSAAVFRELQDSGIDVPGLSRYVQRKISLRKR